MIAPQPFGDPDIGAAADSHPVAQPESKALVEQAVQSIAQVAPAGWESLQAAFSFAGGQEIANVVAITANGPTPIRITAEAIELIRTHRTVSNGSRGPWLRLLFDCDATGALQVAFDYGDNELPAEHLLPPQAYVSDFEEFPRLATPLWLVAYMGNEGQQLRTAGGARQSAVAVGDARESDDEIPPLPALWARIAVLAAVCRGSDAPDGPRTDPAFQLYIGDDGGCTLCRLPGDRAVLSGGRNDSRLLSAAYSGTIGWPDLYRGAPTWLHNLYLDPRNARGLLSFCYWWDGTHWYRSDLPEATPLTRGETPWKPTEEIEYGVPGVWTTEGTANLVKIVLKRIGVELSDRNHYAAIDLVRTAEARIVSERDLTMLFLDAVPESFDIAEALAQLDAADVLLPRYPPIDQATAKDLVVSFCHTNNVDTAGYPLNQLVADRWDTGWQVFVPVPEGETRIDRMFFLVADDGVVEQASTFTSPSEIAHIFANRFAMRVRAR
jgi:hypothetical protein